MCGGSFERYMMGMFACTALMYKPSVDAEVLYMFRRLQR
jgi:hypothetical protein